MMLLEASRLALRAIVRNVLRSVLTVLGVVIGVAAVIAMVAIGQGTTAEVTNQVSELGSDLLLIEPGSIMQAGPPQPAAPFTDRDVTAIREQIPGLATVSPLVARSATVIFGNRNWVTVVEGVEPPFLDVMNHELASGRFFLEGEMRSGLPVCVLGATPKEELFGSGDPVGESVRIRQVSCRVIGVLEAKGASLGQDQDDLVLMPLRTMQRRIAGSQDVDLIFVTVRDPATIAKTQADIEALLRERRRIGPMEDDDFEVADMEEIASMLGDITTILTGLLAALAAISLLVGGIGIMNIMLVSVTERTREIGIRLAIGATGGQVLLQFLVEAIALSLIGGVIGIALGLGLAWGVTDWLGVAMVVDPTIILLAFLFSAAVGVVFGFFPARRAARLDPIVALRHE
ncbi:MAG: ABC transporter permease [Pseudooceanicola sp.]